MKIDDNYVLQAISFDDNTSLDTSSYKVVISLGALESTRIIAKSLNIEDTFPILDHPQSYLCKVYAKSSTLLRKPSYFRHNGKKFKRKFLYTNEQREGILELQEDLSLNTSLFLLDTEIFAKRMLNRIARSLNLNYLFTPDSYNVWIQTDQKVNSDSYTRLQNKEFHEIWTPNNEDAEFALEILCGFSLLSSILKIETRDCNLPLEKVLNLIQHANHPSSSLRLSSYFANIFSDFGKLGSNSNFTVASASVLPSSGWLNPTLLIMGMAYSFTTNLIESP